MGIILILGSENNCLSLSSGCDGDNYQHTLSAFPMPDRVLQAVKLDSNPWHASLHGAWRNETC